MATRKRRLSKVGFNSKLIIDVIGASLIVQKAPLLIDMVFPLDASIRALAGVGVGYLTGSMLKRPDLANASIALGVVDFVSPFVDDLLGGSGTKVVTPPAGGTMPVQAIKSVNTLEKYITLNDYISNPGQRQNYFDYQNSYGY